MTINLFDLFNRADFDAAIEAKLITVRDDGAGLRILNYSDSAMYTPGAWGNPSVRQCRGIIVDDDWNVIARPWAKFFNHGQEEAGPLDLTAPVEVTDKMDGSLGIIHLTKSGQPRVASRGSFESDQAIHATAILHTRYPNLTALDTITPLVEIIYPANRIVVDYGDFDDLVLLGSVNIETGEHYGPGHAAILCGWTGPMAETFAYATLRDALAADPRPGMEGFCCRNLATGHIVKLKQEEYVRLHKIVTGLSERSVWEHMSNGGTLHSMLDGLPDELHAWTTEVWDRLVDEARRIENEARDAYEVICYTLPNDWTRKDFAEQAMKRPDVRPYLFNLLDGRSPSASILKTLRPVGDTRARAISEAVA